MLRLYKQNITSITNLQIPLPLLKKPDGPSKMPKKKTTSAQPIVRIGAAVPDKTVLSKAQKEFNRLTKKIETLEKEIIKWRKTTETLQVRAQTELRPLLLQYDARRADMVRLLDQMYGTKGLTKVQRAKIAEIIQDLAFPLIERGHDDLKPIYDKYDQQGFDAANEEAEQATAEQMKSLMSAMFGIEFDDDADVSTPEKMDAYMREKLQAAQEDAFTRQQQAEERRANRPKTAKQQEREAQQQAETRSISKAVRTLYMDLVKAFHPDREPDEAEKIRKTEVMQRITSAYESSDLLTLLKLQLEFNRIDQNHLENLADEQLKYYNKILREQVQTLEAEADEEKDRLASMSGRGYFVSAYHAELMLSDDIDQLKEQTRQLEDDLITLADVTELKAWLRTYRLDKE